METQPRTAHKFVTALVGVYVTLGEAISAIYLTGPGLKLALAISAAVTGTLTILGVYFIENKPRA